MRIARGVVGRRRCVSLEDEDDDDMRALFSNR